MKLNGLNTWYHLIKWMSKADNPNANSCGALPQKVRY